ncbi:cytochrome c biogenesis protein CcdA [Rhodobacteraceae bacterium NNCM2]|nr:cytochrome c biogenesis protein CcdA [Coraliihabitans acroporae]
MEFDIGYGAAGLAGLLSFLSPCILPIVPFYLCYIAGMSMDALTAEGETQPEVRRRAVLSSIMFAIGVTVIFVGLGATATVFGQQLRDWFDILRYGAAALIIALGLHFLGIVRIGFLYREARLDIGERRWGLIGAFFIGMAFAFGWTPCVGPVLATILFTAGGQETAGQGALLLLAYGIGMTLPFVVAAAFIGPFLRWAKGFRRHLGTVEKVMGALLIVFGLLIATNSMNVIAEWMLRIAPDIGTLQ